MKRILNTISILALTCTALPATAQMVGSVGADLGYNLAREGDSGPWQDKADVASVRLNATGAWAVGNGFVLGADLDLRWDDFSGGGDFDDTEDPDWQYSLGLHGLKQLNDRTRVGVFASFGEQIPQDSDSGDAYDVWLVGLEGQTLLADNVLVFGQIGGGSKLSEGDDDDEGFKDGWVLRAGATWFASDKTAVALSVEHSRTQSYIDGDDPGRFWDVTLAGETRLPTQAPLLATYGISYSLFDSTDEGDDVEETRLFAGIKYLIGADSPRDRWVNGIAYGTPVTPLRASAWTEWAD